MHIRQMTTGDVAAGLRLGAQNGWNQLDRDWLRFLSMEPEGCFLAEMDGRPVGTACTCNFGTVAWVAMVLVDSGYRKQGIGTALMHEVLQFLDDRQVPTVRLDATPLGRPIYEKLGFAADYELARFAGVPLRSIGSAVAPARESLLPEICRFDHLVSGTGRGKFLERLYHEDPAAVRVVTDGDTLKGFLCARPGARAVQLGPCMADPNAGPLLLTEALHRYSSQRVYVDIPLSHTAATHLAQSAGLSVQRHLLRMTRGQPCQERPDWLWASSGPEKG